MPETTHVVNLCDSMQAGTVTLTSEQQSSLDLAGALLICRMTAASFHEYLDTGCMSAVSQLEACQYSGCQADHT